MLRVDLPTAVEARFARDGRPEVSSFTWGSRQLQVTALGRTWLDGSGCHVLVMAEADRAFELLLRRSDLRWRLVGVPSGERLA